MGGADYFGGCQHQSKEPCAACRAHKEKFDALFESLRRPWPRPGARYLGEMEGKGPAKMETIPGGRVLVVQPDAAPVVFVADGPCDACGHDRTWHIESSAFGNETGCRAAECRCPEFCPRAQKVTP